MAPWPAAAAILALHLQALPLALSQETSEIPAATDPPAAGEGVCEMGEDGSCVNPAPEGAPEAYELDVETLPRLHSKKENMFVYDLEGELSEETVKQLMNVSSLIHANKSLDVIWMVTKTVPKNFRNFKRFAKKVLEHIMVNETALADDDVSDARRRKLLRKSVSRSMLLLLQTEHNAVTPFAGKAFHRKVKIATVKRAIRRGRKLMKQGDFDEALLKVTKGLVKAAFAKKGFFDAVRSMGMLLIPAVAIFFFMRKKQGGSGGGGGMTGYLDRQRRGLPRMMESSQQRMKRIRAVRSQILSDVARRQKQARSNTDTEKDTDKDMGGGGRQRQPGGDEKVQPAPSDDDDDLDDDYS